MDPCTPYQYRLQGPHPWAGARDAIMTQWDRVFHALNTRKVDIDEESVFSDFLKVFIIALIAVYVAFNFIDTLPKTF